MITGKRLYGLETKMGQEILSVFCYHCFSREVAIKLAEKASVNFCDKLSFSNSDRDGFDIEELVDDIESVYNGDEIDVESLRLAFEDAILKIIGDLKGADIDKGLSGFFNNRERTDELFENLIMGL